MLRFQEFLQITMLNNRDPYLLHNEKDHLCTINTDQATHSAVKWDGCSPSCLAYSKIWIKRAFEWVMTQEGHKLVSL